MLKPALDFGKQVLSLTRDVQQLNEEVKSIREEINQSREMQLEQERTTHGLRLACSELARVVERVSAESERHRIQMEAEIRQLKLEYENMLLRHLHSLPPKEPGTDLEHPTDR